MEKEYIIACWHCGAEFNVFDSTFCCHFEPTPLCLFCYQCHCNAPESFRRKLLDNAPPGYMEMKTKARGTTERKLGEMLIDAGRVTESELGTAIAMQRELGQKLGEVLIRMGLITPEELELFLLDQKTIPMAHLGEELPDPGLVEKIGPEFCLKHGMIPLEVVEIDEKKILNFAIARKEDLAQIKLCGELSEYVLLPSMGNPDKMKTLLGKIRAIKEVEDILMLR